MAPAIPAMSPLFAKLNWKGDAPVWVLDSPPSFEVELTALEKVPQITTVPQPGSDAPPLPFLLAFVTTRQRVIDIAALLARHLVGDGIVWFAYPKLTSKRYSSELSRDRGWEPLHAAGFDTVRLVAIDEDWSALRFRQRAYMGSKSR